jgi:hypothetical protein
MSINNSSLCWVEDLEPKHIFFIFCVELIPYSPLFIKIEVYIIQKKMQNFAGHLYRREIRSDGLGQKGSDRSPWHQFDYVSDQLPRFRRRDIWGRATNSNSVSVSFGQRRLFQVSAELSTPVP